MTPICKERSQGSSTETQFQLTYKHQVTDKVDYSAAHLALHHDGTKIHLYQKFPLQIVECLNNERWKHHKNVLRGHTNDFLVLTRLPQTQ